MEAAGGVGWESDRGVVNLTAGRQKHAQHVMLTTGSIGRMWRALEELKLKMASALSMTVISWL